MLVGVARFQSGQRVLTSRFLLCIHTQRCHVSEDFFDLIAAALQIEYLNITCPDSTLGAHDYRMAPTILIILDVSIRS